jgi:hypothetical protein
VAETSTQDVLRWEARQGPRAAVAAGLAAVLIVGSGFATQALSAGAPSTGFVDSLRRLERSGSVGDQPSLRTPYFEYYDRHGLEQILSALALALGYAAIAFMLTYLGIAVHNRFHGFRRTWIYIALVGGVLGAVATMLLTVGIRSEFSQFLDGPHTVDRAQDVGDAPLLVAAQLIGVPGTGAIGLASLALGLGWVVICLNAMRVGLLTRFMGVLGIICGALIVLPLLSSLPVVQTFWLAAMALLLLGRWPNGVPPAWRTGEAQPWPSQQEAIAARRRGAGAEPEPDGGGSAPAAEAAGGDGRGHPVSRKKKRKRRA